VRYYNEERLHSTLKYLRLVDYYLGNPQALLAKRKNKLRGAASRRKEVNRGKKEIRFVNGAPELGQEEIICVIKNNPKGLDEWNSKA
jgi:hypothetical protein